MKNTITEIKNIPEGINSRITEVGTSLLIQQLRCQASIAGGIDSIPGQGIRIPHAMQCSKVNKIKKNNN